jgi:hypothetical protein
MPFAGKGANVADGVKNIAVTNSKVGPWLPQRNIHIAVSVTRALYPLAIQPVAHWWPHTPVHVQDAKKKDSKPQPSQNELLRAAMVRVTTLL